jgi:putative thioredoxin
LAGYRLAAHLGLSLNGAPVVAEASAANFADLVLGNSHKGLVLVYYWSPQAGPCMRLMPRLLELARVYAGRFLLVLANTDELAALARGQGVNSVPTVKFYLRGAVTHTIHGAESDAVFRAALAGYVSLDEDTARAEAWRAERAGDRDAAIAILASAAVERSEDLDIGTDLAKLLLLDGQAERALALLAALPGEARRDARVAPLLAHLQLIDAARNGPEDCEARLAADGDDAEARLARAARALFEDRHEAALDDLLHVARHAPEYRDDLGRRALLALFGMLGAEHPLTRRYRARLAAAAS